MASTRWSPEEIAYLVSNPDQFIKEHPETTRNSLLTLRRYYLKKLKEIDMEGASPDNINANEVHELLKPLGDVDPANYEIGYHRGFIKNQDGEIELTPPLYSVKPKRGVSSQQLSDFISQADPVKITPNKRKPAKRDHNVMVVFSDTQIGYMDINGDGELTPIHDEAYISVVRQVCADYRPEYIVDTSDTVDFSSISRFPADSPRFNISLNHSINRAHRMYAELRADNPDSKIIAVDSNHTQRLAKFLMKQVPELYGIRQAGNESMYPALTYPFLMNFEALDVKWYGGYGSAEYVHGEEYGAPPIVFRHGNSAVNNGSTAAKEAKENPETHVVRGHSHRAELFHTTTRSGRYLTSMVIGCGCHTEGHVPSYHSSVDDNGKPVHHQENWSQSIGLIFDYKDGNYDFNHIMVNRGVGRFNGKVYNGNE